MSAIVKQIDIKKAYKKVVSNTYKAKFFCQPHKRIFSNVNKKRLATLFQNKRVLGESTRDNTHMFKEPAFLTFLGMLPSNSGKVITRRAFPTRNTTTVASICRGKSQYVHDALLCNVMCKAQNMESEKNFYLTKENPPDQCQHISKRGTCSQKIAFQQSLKAQILYLRFFSLS